MASSDLCTSCGRYPVEDHGHPGDSCTYCRWCCSGESPGVFLPDAEAAEVRQWIRELAEAGFLTWDPDDLDNWPRWARRFRPLWDRLGECEKRERAAAAVDQLSDDGGTDVPATSTSSTRPADA